MRMDWTVVRPFQMNGTVKSCLILDANQLITFLINKLFEIFAKWISNLVSVAFLKSTNSCKLNNVNCEYSIQFIFFPHFVYWLDFLSIYPDEVVTVPPSFHHST